MQTKYQEIKIPIFDASIQSRLAQSLEKVQAEGFVGFEHKYNWEKLCAKRDLIRQEGMRRDFMDEYKNWCKFASEKQKRELTSSEETRIFVDFLRIKMGLDPLPRPGSVK